MAGLKKDLFRIVIDEDGNMSVDNLCGTGPSCAKELEEWTNLAGGGVTKVVKKPEFFKTEKKRENLNIQKQ